MVIFIIAFLEVVPISWHEKAIRIEFFGDEVDKIVEYDIVTGTVTSSKKSITLFAASHFVTNEDNLKKAIINNAYTTESIKVHFLCSLLLL